MKAKFVIAIILSLFFAGVASAAIHVELVLDSKETTAGESISGRLIVLNTSKVAPPEFPEVDDVLVRVASFPNQYYTQRSINGKDESTRSLVYSCEFTPLKPGKYVIPQFGVVADGKTYYTRPVTFVAARSSTTSDELLAAEIVCNKKQAYVGEELRLTLKIYIKPFYARRYNLRLTPPQMFSRLRLNECKWGPFESSLQELLKQRQLPEGTEVLKNDKDGQARSYYLYELEKIILPNKQGKIDESNVVLFMDYPESINRNIFGELQLEKVKSISTQAKAASVEVLELPAKNRPATFNGVIGKYGITVSALPRIVHVGEPITLTIRITGDGKMESLPAPNLAEMPELNKNFKVPTESLAGVVSNGSKTFVTSIRPKNDEVKCIPSIPLTFFDTEKGKYMTVGSEPIAIMVKPAEKLKMQNIVSANGNMGSETSHETVTGVEGGIFANVTDINKLMGSGGGMNGKGKLVLLIAAPVLFVLLALVRLIIYLGGGEQAKRRRAAAGNARSRLSSAKTPDDVAAAILGYVADKTGKVLAGMTSDEAMTELKKWKLPQATLDKVDTLLRNCEEMQYSTSAAGEVKELADKARECFKLI